MRFELHDITKKSPLYYIIRKNRKGHKIFLKYPVGISLTKSQWTGKRVKDIKGIPSYEWNKKLKLIDDTVRDIFATQDYFSLTADNVRDKIDIALGLTNGRDTFDDYLQNWIDTNKDKKGYNTIKSWITLQNKLPKNLSWNDFDYAFYRDFISEMEKKDYSLNYIGKMIKNLTIVLNDSVRDGVNKNTEFKKWKRLSEKVYNIYLSEDELIAIHNSNPPEYLHKYKDLFLVGCFTGLRVGNYRNIDPNLQIKNGIITAIVNKGGGRVKIPVHWIVNDILKKYKGLPPNITEQKLNENIKLVCQFVANNGCESLKENVFQVKTIGGKRTEIVKKKWEMVTTHTARRSMVTNLYLRHVPLQYIMSITGHKTERQCFDYIKSGIDEHLDEIVKLDFWNK